MAQQRQSSLRFRLPWLRATPAPLRPPAQSTDEKQIGSIQPTNSPARTPITRPGVAPTPAQAATARSRRSRASHQTVSSPTRASTQPRDTSQAPSPTRASLKTTQAESVPGEAVTHHPLPSENLQPRTQSTMTFQPSSESEEEPKPARSEAETASENEPTQMHPTFAEKKQMEEEDIIGRKEDSTVNLNLKDKTTVSESGHKEIRGDIFTLLDNERPVNFITLAGENRGASMQIGSESARGEGTVTIGTKSNSEGNMSLDSKTVTSQESKSYINSNVQSINNSIMINSSITERDPGIQLVRSSDQTEPFKPNTSMESLETRKAEVNVTSAQKLTYEPTVRTYLRGLFIEPSNSDKYNPEKSQNNEIDVL